MARDHARIQTKQPWWVAPKVDVEYVVGQSRERQTPSVVELREQFSHLLAAEATYWAVELRRRLLTRKPIPKRVRGAVYARDGHACVTCGSADNLTLDHIVPWSLCGSDDESNLQTLCRSCNSRKGVAA